MVINLLKLMKFLKPYKKQCIIAPAFKLIEAILELLLPTMMAIIINNGVAYHNESYVLKIGSIMIIMAICGFISSMICQYNAALVSQGFGTALRNNIFDHISSLSYAEIDSFGTATLINRITNDVNQLQLAVAMLIRLVIRAPFICIGAIVMAMMLDLKLSLILIAAAPIFALIIYFIINTTSPLYRKYQKKLDAIALVLRENLSGVRVIRAFAKTEDEKSRFDNASNGLTATAIHVGKVSALLSPMTSLVINSAVIAILWTGALHINSGSLSQGSIIAFVNYITQILLALIVISNLVIIFTKAFASANRINEVLAATSSVPDAAPKSASETASYGSPKIEFKNVSFGYSTTGDMALTDICASINPGETVGIIGSTGSGKSTFVNLIPRFYDVTNGEILIDGINVKDYSLKNLKNKIKSVPQKAVLFSGTIKENILWGNENASDEEIISALKVAQAYEFVSKLPDGLCTQVSRGGMNFSGGQKQRLTIARAIIAHPEILILDDSSSALDFATDAALRNAIKESSKNTTVLIVSQRASTVKYADKIIVFDDGKISGIGTHDKLWESSAVYKEICLSQLSEKEVTR